MCRLALESRIRHHEASDHSLFEIPRKSICCIKCFFEAIDYSTKCDQLKEKTETKLVASNN